MRHLAIIACLLLESGVAMASVCVATSHSPSYCTVTSSAAICYLPAGHQGARMWTSDDSGTSTLYLEVEFLDGSLEPWYAMERRCEVFTLSAGGTIELHGTSGRDVIALARGDEDLAPPPSSSGLSIEVYAGDGDDLIVGSGDTSLVQYFFGESGNDVIYLRDAGGVADGGDGNDTLWGGIEPDDLIGGPGDDSLHSGGGQMNTLDGGPGIDTFEEWGVITAETASVEYPPGHFNVPLAALYGSSVGYLHADYGGDWVAADLALTALPAPRLLIVDPSPAPDQSVSLTADVSLGVDIDLTIERVVVVRTMGHTMTINGEVIGLASGALDVGTGAGTGAFVFDGNARIHVPWFSDADDTAKVQRAINAATWSGAKTVFFPAGAYGLGPASPGAKGPIVLNNASAPSRGGVSYSYDGLIFSGAGQEATRLEWIGGTVTVSNGEALFYLDARSQPLNSVVIEKMTLEGNADWNHLYDFTGTIPTSCTTEVADRSIAGVRALGPAFATTSGVLGHTNMRVEDVTTKFSRTGFTLRDGEWNLHNVHTRDHTCHGLGVTHNADVDVADSLFERSGGAFDMTGGLLDLLGARVTTFIENSTFRDNRFHGGKFGSSASVAAEAAAQGRYANGDRELIEGLLDLVDVSFSNNRQSGFSSSLPGFSGVFTTPSTGGTSVDIYLDLNLELACIRCNMEANRGRGLSLDVNDDCYSSSGCHGLRATLVEGSFSDNGANGIQVTRDAALDLKDSAIHRNARHGIYMQTEDASLDGADIQGNNPVYSGIRLVETPGRTGTATIKNTTIIHCAGFSGCTSIIPEGHDTVDVEITDSNVERVHTGLSTTSQFSLIGTVFCTLDGRGQGYVTGACIP